MNDRSKKIEANQLFVTLLLLLFKQYPLKSEKYILDIINRHPCNEFKLTQSYRTQLLSNYKDKGLGLENALLGVKKLRQILVERFPNLHFKKYENNPGQYSEELLAERNKRKSSTKRNESKIKLYPKLTPALLTKQVQNETQEIKIQKTGLYDFTLSDILSDIEEEGIIIKILILHPNSQAAAIRNRGLDRTKTKAGRERIITNLHALAGLDLELSKKKCQLEARLYHELPGVSCYIFSKKILIGWYLLGIRSSQSQFLEIDRVTNTEFAFTQLEDNFDKLWEKADQFDLSNLDELEKEWEEKYQHQQIGQTEGEKELLKLLEVKDQSTQFKKYLGKWRLFYLKNKPRDSELKDNKKISEIGNNFMTIYSENGLLKCSMDFLGRSRTREFYTGLVNTVLDNRYFMECILYSDNRDKVLYILFDLRYSQKELFGSFTNKYDGGNIDIGSGKAVLVKVKDSQQMDNLESINPISGTNAKLVKDSRIINYLLFQNKTLITPINGRDNLSDYTNLHVNGYFELYAYGRKDKVSCLSLTSLEIHPSGYAVHRREPIEGESIKGSIAYGQARKVEDNLIIDLVNADYEREGHFIISVGQSSLTEGTLFCGVFSGVSYHQRKPVASLIILRFKEKISKRGNPVKARKIELYSKDFFNIPEEIRKALVGRENKFISLGLRNGTPIYSLKELKKENEYSIKYDILFYESAMHNAEHGNPERALKMIKRAIQHGLQEVATFETQVKDTDTFKLLKEDDEYQHLKKLLPS